tara:strand:+ start:216 stop:335 length:120 start_codon:yes stop_codon:yes gene_type:complete
MKKTRFYLDYLVIFSLQDNGRHNETSWATAILEILGKLI